MNAIIKQYQLTHIDLLKIDVEGHEWPILENISNHHWPVIKHIAIEISKHNPHKDNLIQLLKKQGYHISFKSHSQIKDPLIQMLYASK